MNGTLRAALTVTLAVLVSCDAPPSMGDETAPVGVASVDTSEPAAPSVAGAPVSFVRGLAHERAGAIALRRLAAGRGALRVIVGVRTPYVPEGRLTNAGQLGAQHRAIAGAQAALLAAHGGPDVTEIRRFARLPFLALQVTPAGLDALLGDADVTSVEEDRPVPPTLSESVPLVGAPAVWTAGFTGAGQAVAILDTGVDKDHAFLAGKVIDEACYSTNNSGERASSVCPGGVTEAVGDGAGLPCPLNVEGCEHGTHVAAIAASDDATLRGVAPDADVIAIQVFSRFNDPSACWPSSACALAYPSDIIAGLEHVLEVVQDGTPVAAANMSLGAGYSNTACDSLYPAEKAAIDALRSVGTATIVSAGNEGFRDGVAWPACISTAVAIGATTKADVVDVAYTNGGSLIGLLAPGSSITSAVPGGGTATWDGTSMAAPHVAGAWALLKQKMPAATVSSVLTALKSTGVPLTDSRNNVTKPRIRIDHALLELKLDPVEMSPPPSEYPGPQVVTLTTTPGAIVHTTVDGSTPSPTNGLELQSGDGLLLSSATTLSAYATFPDVADTPVVVGRYSFPANLTVTLEPAAAVTAGARWRMVGYSVDTFEEKRIDRWLWAPSGWGTWTIATFNAHESRYSMRPPGTPDSASSTNTVSFQSDGGDIVFWYKVSSEENGDFLEVSIDNVVVDRFSGEIDWTEARYPVGAGQRFLAFTYRKDAADIAGDDAAWIDDLELPGDQWRASGVTARGLNRPSVEIKLKDAGAAWATPANRTFDLGPSEAVTTTVTYERNAVAAPVFDPPAGVYNQTTAVSITTATPGATIRYTTDGSAPTSTSPTYTTPITVPSGAVRTIRATASLAGLTDASASATYEITGALAKPTFTPAPGTYTVEKAVTLASTTPGATIRYTTDGSDPTATSDVYTAPISVGLDSTVTIKAEATKDGWTSSGVATGTFVVTGTVATPQFSIDPGLYASAQTLALATTTTGATIRYTTNGAAVTATSPAYTAPLQLPSGSVTRVRARAFKASWADSAEVDGTFELTGVVGTPRLSPAPGTYTTPQTVTLSASPPTATIHFTTDGSTPTPASPVYTTPLYVGGESTLTVRALAVQADWADSEEASGTWRVTGVVAPPTISPGSGTFTTPVDVLLTAAAPEDVVHFTLDGSEPTTASSAYTGRIRLPLGTTTKVRAASFREGWATSEIVEATYELTGTVGKPTSNPAPGAHVGLTQITLATPTTGATLRYTTDGEPVTEASPAYTAPIPIATGATLRLRARAWRTGWIASDELDGTFRSTGVVAKPTFSPAAGAFTSAQQVAVTTTTPGATIHVTVDGTPPTTASPVYTAPIVVGLDSTVTIRAIAVLEDWTTSPEATGTWVVTGTLAKPSFSLPPGRYGSPQQLSLATTSAGARIRYTLDGTEVTSSSTVYAGSLALDVDTVTRVRAKAFLTGWAESPEADGTFEVTAQVDDPTFTPPPGTYTTTQSVRLGTGTPGATVRYTTDGSEPTETSTLYTGPIRVAAGSVTQLRARAFRPSWAPSRIVEGTYVLASKVTLGFAGAPPAGNQVASGSTAVLAVSGGVGPFFLDPVEDRDGVPAQARVLDRTVTVDVPSAGAFAGRYTVRVTDGTTGDTAELPLLVPPVLQVLPATLEGGGTATVTVLGGTPGVSFPLSVDVPSGVAAGTVDATAAPGSDPAHGNPATAKLATTTVTTTTLLQVLATVDTVAGSSNVVTVSPVDDDTDVADTDTDDTDRPTDSDDPQPTDDGEDTGDDGGDGCGCASGRAPAWLGVLVLALAATRRRRAA